MHALMVPAIPRAPETIETLPEPPATMASHDGVQRGDHVAIPPQPRPRRPVVRRPRQPHGLAGAPHRDPVLLHQHRQDFPFRGRRHRFRLRTSLIAAFSSARSAYIRLSLAFSASSSFSRFNSPTDAPAYFARHWKYVALLMLCWRRISAIGTPASPCFKISTIWLSVNRDFRMGASLAPESLPSKCLPKREAYAYSTVLGDPWDTGRGPGAGRCACAAGRASAAAARRA